MPDYDVFAETYQHWCRTAKPYNVVETYTFFQTLGSIDGLDILDLAAGEGRLSRMLMERGARSVLGGELSPEMVRRAVALNEAAGGRCGLRYAVLDARDDEFTLDPPVDVVTAMYLLHYAASEEDLLRMGRLIARNLRPGGRFVTYTINPDFDFTRPDPLLRTRCGFTYEALGDGEAALVIGDERVSLWQWSRAAHEACLAGAGLTDIRWHPLELPADMPEVAEEMGFYLANPSCTVLSARKTG